MVAQAAEIAVATVANENQANVGQVQPVSLEEHLEHLFASYVVLHLPSLWASRL